MKSCYFCDEKADYLSPSGVLSCAPCRRTHDLEESKPKEDSDPSKLTMPEVISYSMHDEGLPGDFVYDEAEDPPLDYEPDPSVTCSLDCPTCLTLTAEAIP